jgi:hypothetical protein
MSGGSRPPIPFPDRCQKGCQPVIDGPAGVAREREKARQVGRQGLVFRVPFPVLTRTFGQIHGINRASSRVALHSSCHLFHPNVTGSSSPCRLERPRFRVLVFDF